jgi:stage II sporulation protein R
MFENSSSAEDSAKIAVDNLSEICRIANDEIIKNGFHYCVNATVDKLSFPTKTYGDISLPSGRYMALRIEIGSGKGENWWCVMYPPLCLTDGILSCPDESKNKLKSSLTDEEYRLVTKEDSDRLPVEIRFKIVEIFQKLF